MSRGISIKELICIPIKFSRIFRKEKFDAIYYMSPNASFYAALAGVLSRTPTRIYAQAGIRYVSFTGMKRFIFRTLEKMTCILSTHIKAQSRKNMQFAIDEKLCRANKISVVGIGGTTGVSLKECDSFDHSEIKIQNRKKYNIDQDAFVFGYVGRINADKGIGELIVAFESLQPENPDIWLVLVGMMDDTNPIPEDLMVRAKNNEHIVFTGNVPIDEVYKHMAMFDVLTHPTYREGFGKVLQEATGMRLPVITTNVPGPSEVVEENVSGVLAEVRNPQSLAESMAKLLHNEQFRNTIAENGRRRAEKYFDRPIMLKNQVDAIVEIVNSK